MVIFAERLRREREDMSKVDILGKFAGAVGNYNAHVVAYPDVNWPLISQQFVNSLGLTFNPYITQAYYIFFIISLIFFKIQLLTSSSSSLYAD